MFFLSPLSQGKKCPRHEPAGGPKPNFLEGTKVSAHSSKRGKPIIGQRCNLLERCPSFLDTCENTAESVEELVLEPFISAERSAEGYVVQDLDVDLIGAVLEADDSQAFPRDIGTDGSGRSPGGPHAIKNAPQ